MPTIQTIARMELLDKPKQVSCQTRWEIVNSMRFRVKSLDMRHVDIRHQYLKFFEGKGHKIMPSDSLIPSGDPSLLFTSAGMTQFKDMFLGSKRLPYTRITTCQKCMRTADIERVGTTARHLTFFEMLGNFSFGDYFKKEAIEWAWEFFTKTLGIPESKLYASIYKDDDEAFDVWNKVIRLPHSKIFRMGEADNFWPANAPSQGPNGPCGPCSEIYYDFGEKYGCGKPTCTVGCDCDRYVEVWNLVFTQFDRQDGGKLVPLPRKNIDTGMGLERLCAILQGVHSNFETDLFVPVIKSVLDSTGLKMDASNKTRIHRIADHLRSITFCIADGVIPSNEERGYVVRRLIRSALRDLYLLGIREPFLHKQVGIVVQEMQEPYPMLLERKIPVENMLKAEEERFLETLENGMAKYNEIAAKGKISGSDAFLLYDSFGFPIEMTISAAKESGIPVDVEGFKKLLEGAREKARKGARFGPIFEKKSMIDLKKFIAENGPFEFTGYDKKWHDKLEDKTTLCKMLDVAEDKLVDSATQGKEVLVLLRKTPFYGESGGQVGDTGTICGKDFEIEVTDTQKVAGVSIHYGIVRKGTARAGAEVIASVNEVRRKDIMRNHTGTHILQAALRQVLGKDVQQAGSIVLPDRLRFDFTFPRAPTKDEIRKIEEIVNQVILEDLEVEKIEMPFEEAVKTGALMFFGEKYGERVRVVKAGDFSIELCGGTHLERTSHIGLFKITYEGSIGSGVRRLEAVTGRKAVELALSGIETINRVSKLLQVPPEKLAEKVEMLADKAMSAKQKVEHTVEKIDEKLHALEEVARRKLSELGVKGEKLNDFLTSIKASFESSKGRANPAEILKGAKNINGYQVVIADVSESTPDEVRGLTDQLVKKHGAAATLISFSDKGRHTFIIGLREDLVKKGLNAGTIAKQVGAACGANGGGKPHLAQAGMKSHDQRERGVDIFFSTVSSFLSSGGSALA